VGFIYLSRPQAYDFQDLIKEMVAGIKKMTA
jgi:hypothetical protein